MPGQPDASQEASFSLRDSIFDPRMEDEYPQLACIQQYMYGPRCVELSIWREIEYQLRMGWI